MLHPRYYHGVVDPLDAAIITTPDRPAAQRKLAPGERIINGGIHYGAAWLGVAAAFEPEAVKGAHEAARGVPSPCRQARPGRLGWPRWSAW